MAFSEIILVLIISILCLRPDEMVKTMRALGVFIGRMRKIWNSSFKPNFDKNIEDFATALNAESKSSQDESKKAKTKPISQTK